MESKAKQAASVETLKFKLTIAYDGTNYAGWQVQKIGMGVQQSVEEALGKLFPSGRGFTVPAGPIPGSMPWAWSRMLKFQRKKRA